jgi:LysM repeat protein
MDKKKLICVVALLALAWLGMAQSKPAQPDVLAYIRQYQQIAIAEMQRTGVPAAITLAQGIFESASGKSNLCVQSNNHFGIKCKLDWQGEKVYHNDDEEGECFRKYTSAEESFVDHSNFLTSRKHYAFLFQLPPTDYKAWAHGLKKAGYATNPSYPQRLIQLIEDYNLNEHTLAGLTNKPDDSTNMVNVAASTTNEEPATAVMMPPLGNTTEDTLTVTVLEIEPVAVIDTSAPSMPKQEAALAPQPTYPTGVFEINGCKVIWASAETSLLQIAYSQKISLAHLLYCNEWADTTSDVLTTPSLVFLQRKQKKGDTAFYTVKPGDTVETIAQQCGILTSSLLAFNRIPAGKQVAPGEKLYLQNNSPATPKLL